MKVVYVAHPLGFGDDRERNRVAAAYWCGWLADKFGIAPVADWIVLSSVWEEDRREQGLAIDLALIARCDELWLVGGRVSQGMAIERAEAERLGKPVVDLTHLGPFPPTGADAP